MKRPTGRFASHFFGTSEMATCFSSKGASTSGSSKEDEAEEEEEEEEEEAAKAPPPLTAEEEAADRQRVKVYVCTSVWRSHRSFSGPRSVVKNVAPCGGGATMKKSHSAARCSGAS